MRIEIQNALVDERKGKISRGERAGEEFHIRQQEAWMHTTGKPYPSRVMISLQPEQQAYAPGFYTLHDDSFQSGEYDRMEFSRYLVLTPEVAAVRSAPAAAKVG